MFDLLEQALSHAPLAHVPGLSECFLRRGEVRTVDAGRSLIAQGQAIDALLVPINRALLKTVAGSQSPSERLRACEPLALPQLFAGAPCPYGVRAEHTAFVLALPRLEFLELLSRIPTIDHWLRLTTASRALLDFDGLLLDRGISRDDIARAIARVNPTPRELAAGDALPDSASVWFVESGQLQLVQHGPSGRKASVKGPAFFGGQALVMPFRAAWSGVAETACVLYEMPASEAYALLTELDLIELLYDEPHVRTATGGTGAAVESDLPPLPGAACNADDLWQFGLRVGAERLIQDARTQQESNVAAVANLLLFLGVPLNLSSLRSGLSQLPRLSYLKIAEVIEPYGVAARASAAQVSTLHRHALPALVALSGRLCVLLSIRRYAVVHDPTRGFVEVPLPQLASLWDGGLLEASPVDVENVHDDAAEPGTSRVTPTIRALLDILRDNRALTLNAGLLSLVTIFLGLVQPWLAQMVLDEVLTLRDNSVLVSCAAGMLLAATVFAIVRWLQQVVFAELTINFDTRLGELFYRRALGLPMGAAARYRAGDVLARLGDLDTMRDFCAEEVLQVVVKVGSVFIVTGLLAWYDGTIALLGLATGVLTLLIQLALGGTLSRNYEQSARAATRATSLVTEQVAAAATVKAFGAATALRERWERASMNARQLALRNALLSEGASTGLQLLAAFARIGGLWLAARSALAGAATPGQILAISMYLNHIVERLADIGGFFARWWGVRIAFNNVSRILDAPPDTPWQKAATTLSCSLTGRVRIEGLCFRYGEHADWVLQDVELSIFPRQIVALVGRSGCGKTTLAHLLAGNLTPSAGKIFYDGIDSELVERGSLRRQIGFVTQAHQLFQGTIGENIAFADDAPSEQRVGAAAQDANASPFISRLPLRYESVLGEGGAGLSGGQMQRLSIARTLYREPSILIFDEATSQLDAESEEAIVENMRRILQGRTSIIIAHRLSTIRHADVIFVMDRGRIVEKGTHHELMAQGGHYTELFADQDFGAPA